MSSHFAQPNSAKTSLLNFNNLPLVSRELGNILPLQSPYNKYVPMFPSHPKYKHRAKKSCFHVTTVTQRIAIRTAFAVKFGRWLQGLMNEDVKDMSNVIG